MEINSGENQQEESCRWLKKYLNHQSDWLEKTRGNLMIVATVIASMSFQVMVNPPGGVWQSDECSENHVGVCKQKAGTSIMENHYSTKRDVYLGMVIFSAVSFSASMSLILLIIMGLQLRNRLIMATVVIFMTVAVICISGAFYCAVTLVHHLEDHFITAIREIYVAFWIVFPILVLISQLIRFTYKLICCVCCQRRRRSPRRLLPSTPTSAR
ncbi:uncharacterized protein LOC108846075 [Raphanus sativus]|uniref:Uncharacterized protein LOC108846075 n=1 Tax=Raphanus sativus TaxID=3726 RepID=A0A6J0MQQ4_RAPSA|nr:uncharacterized protein LOC108846075 [Raphanus sativus]